MTFHIRPALPTDLPSILTLERATPTAPHWPLSEYENSLTTPSNSNLLRCLYLAESIEEGALLGFVIGKLLLSPNQPASPASHSEAELESIAVSPAARRLGIGTALCRAVIVWAAEHHASWIDLEVRSTSPATLLYQKLGFLAYAHRPAYYRSPTDDATCMRLNLKHPSNPPR